MNKFRVFRFFIFYFSLQAKRALHTDRGDPISGGGGQTEVLPCEERDEESGSHPLLNNSSREKLGHKCYRDKGSEEKSLKKKKRKKKCGNEQT